MWRRTELFDSQDMDTVYFSHSPAKGLCCLSELWHLCPNADVVTGES